MDFLSHNFHEGLYHCEQILKLIETLLVKRFGLIFYQYLNTGTSNKNKRFAGFDSLVLLDWNT